ncbi:MAG: helix-hairpin-helix domain-containing protein [Gammaproteobacteria bacterium]|nr:helix-hairpin-helix domain-containing protein [Gammaproteobacteria bacterium]
MLFFRLVFSVLALFCVAFAMPANAATHKSQTKSQTSSQQKANKVDINSADVAALEALKGIGDKKAQAIVDYRTKNGAFKSVNDLTAVQGISDQFITKLKQDNSGMLVARHVK